MTSACRVLSSLVIIVLVLSLAALSYASERIGQDTVDRWRGRVRSHLSNIQPFKGQTERLFPRFSQGQQREIEERVSYVVRQTRLELSALNRFAQARGRVLSLSGTMSAARRHNALLQAVEAFEDYRVLFDPQVERAFVDYPVPAYRRLIERLDDIPFYRYAERSALMAEIETTFFEYSDAFVDATSTALNERRDGLYYALRNLQYAGSGFDMSLQYRFDRTFFAYQALLEEKGEPGYGVVQARDFPVDAIFEPVPIFQPTAYGRQYSQRVRLEEIERMLPEAYADIRSLPPEALSREARRIRELHELVGRYERAAQQGDQAALDEAWKSYEQLRDRWDLIP